VISAEENEKLTRVRPGTPLGELLRHYWHPVAVAGPPEVGGTLAVRLLGEDFVVVRGLDGALAVLERVCAHRGGDLAEGDVEEYGLRCPRHGWLYGFDGQCLEQPMEEAPFCNEVRLGSYLAEERGGLLWLYAGPRPAPRNPHWQPYDWDDALVQVAFADLACNWLQCQEEAMELPLQAGVAPERAVVEETEAGYAISVNGEARRLAIWPNGLAIGDERSSRLEWRVPIDDTRTRIFARFADRPAPGTALPAQRFFSWRAPVEDEKGRVLRGFELNQRFALWLSQGAVLDRSQERLGEGDAGLLALRQKLLSQADLIADGGLPKRVAIDENPITLPLTRSPATAKQATFTAIAGQPPAAQEAYEALIAGWQS
jgi:5,5'-dehydrodivanillate O-demethylase